MSESERWLEKKKIPAHRIGRLCKFQASEVDQWVRCEEPVKFDEENK